MVILFEVFSGGLSIVEVESILLESLVKVSSCYFVKCFNDLFWKYIDLI